MRMAALPSPSPLLIGLTVLLVLVVGVFLGIRLARTVLRHRVARTRRLGRAGNETALKLLARGGWQILGTEVTAEGRLEIDGESRTYVVRADALVRKRRRTYVAEFKGGPQVARIAHRFTRRQLLEYALLFEVDGVLLVDADAKKIHRVEFPGLRP